jgi:DNA-binding SARP family transcriptional activator
MKENLEQHHYRFFLLGGLRIEQWAGESWQLAAPLPTRTHHLLSILLMRPQPLARDLLADLLFPLLSTQHGRQRVRDLLWLIGKGLPELEIVQLRNSVHLPAEQRWLDVEAFAYANERGAWGEAIALYGGELESWDVRWLEEQANSLNLQFVALLHEAARTLFRQSMFSEGIIFAQRMVNAEPFDEEALRLLMRYYQMLGQRGAGLTAYERFAKSAEKQLGIRPALETRQLADALQDALPAELISTDVQGNPLQLLFSRAQSALERADQREVVFYLDRLQAFVRAGAVPPALLADIQWLHVDLALFQMDLTKAQRLLDDCTPAAPETELRQAWIMWRRKSADAVPLIKQLLVSSAFENNPSFQIRAHLLFAHISVEFENNMRQANQAVDKAFHLARNSKHYILQCRTLLTRAKLEFLQQKAEALRISVHEALAIAETYQLRLECFQAVDWLAALHKSTGDYESAHQLAQQSFALAKQLKIPFHTNHARSMLAITHIDLCEYDRALALLLPTRDFFMEQGDDYNRARIEYCIGAAMLESTWHDNADALTYAQSASQIMRNNRVTMVLPVMLEGQGLIHFQLAEYDEVIACGDEILRLAEQANGIAYRTDGLWLKAAGLIGNGAAQAALALTQEMMVEVVSSQFDQRARPSRFWLHATALLATGQIDEGDKFLRQAVEQIDTIADGIQQQPLRQIYLNESLNRQILQDAAKRSIGSKHLKPIF